ncbi:dienelactone hydrolase family protein [Sphaerospermopsis aphanizomenoides BCCUSP55]|uniref:dienelactone hydrolase family protein n=1 Tax=Sphaerospermopsis aphanizomenoides TaxID=459663 RepID=UPI001903D60D|nr:dienelactone hydrolase family protein [Sphaerospermopsis aphanizomenoides]MBK1989577.1 dienelactone hydrolase family protein [Sphaerospermopsis aphanizomenoides BCCUSP55]
MNTKESWNVVEQIVTVELGLVRLKGELVIPPEAQGIVVFAHCSGSSRYSNRNHYLAHLMRQQEGLATMLIDLLTEEEDTIDQRTQHFRCDISFLTSRLISVTEWLFANRITRHLKVGYFGVNRGSGAAFLAALACPMSVGAIVCRSGYTDLVSESLSSVQTPTLLIVGGNDCSIIAMNEDALTEISTQHKQLEIIPGASHKFSEPGAMEEVARLASQWFKCYLTPYDQRELNLHAMPL